MKFTRSKKQIIILLLVVALVVIASQVFKWYLSETVLGIINKNPNRKYQLTFEKLNIHSFYSGFDISGIEVVPLKKDSLEIEGNIKNLELKEVNWGKLLLKNSLSINNLTIHSPEILLRKDTLYHEAEIDTSKIHVKRKTERVIQELLADFLVNFELKNLEIANLSLHSLKDGEETPGYGVEKLNVSAFGIRSDSVVLTYIVPFQLDSILVYVNNAYYQINPYYKAYIGKWYFNSMDSIIKLKSIGIELSRRWDSVSVDLGYQTDIFELYIDSIVMKDIRLYGDSNNLDHSIKKWLYRFLTTRNIFIPVIINFGLIKCDLFAHNIQIVAIAI
jgi:predicted nucleic acid-binding protein